jgi:MerR family transcriptional regulator, light-induced transcriptional regulator
MIQADSFAARYLDRLLAFDQEGALAEVRRMLDAGTSLRSLYLDGFEPVQHEVGRLWERNLISVAHEHYCTAITQLALAETYPRFIRPSHGAPRMIVTCVPGELHELGGRMVADFFELEGWDATYLGEPARLNDVLSALTETGAMLLGISVTMTHNLPSASELISQVRERFAVDVVKILIGGRALAMSHKTWTQLGADGSAEHADQAVELGRRLCQPANAGTHAATLAR